MKKFKVKKYKTAQDKDIEILIEIIKNIPLIIPIIKKN